MNPINPLSALNNIGANEASRTSIANDFDTFLTLLTTQLRNQNPLEPLDTNQFTQQLVQFSEVEQAIKSNDNLENLLQLQAATAITNSVAYIGKTVELTGTTQTFQNGEASWPINVASDVENATFSIKDENGNLIFSETKSLSAGNSEYQWNGQTLNGTTAPEGNYTLSVSAVDGNGTGINVNIASSGVVEGVDFGTNGTTLLVAGRNVNLEDIISIRQ